VPATFDDLIHVRYDGVLVSVRGVVRTADKRSDQNTMTSDLLLLTEGGTIKVLADRFSAKELEALLDAEVEITGVAGGQFDGKTQMRGIQFSVSSPADVKILKYASASPWSLPLIPMDQIMTGIMLRIVRSGSESRNCHILRAWLGSCASERPKESVDRYQY